MCWGPALAEMANGSGKGQLTFFCAKVLADVAAVTVEISDLELKPDSRRGALAAAAHLPSSSAAAIRVDDGNRKQRRTMLCHKEIKNIAQLE